MAGGTPARQNAIERVLTTWSSEALAAVIVDAIAVAGEEAEWDSETIEFVLGTLLPVTDGAALPGLNATDYWRSVTGNDCESCRRGMGPHDTHD